MKTLYIKKMRPCFGKKKMFFKENIKKCKNCQFKRRCLLKVRGIKDGGEEDEKR